MEGVPNERPDEGKVDEEEPKANPLFCKVDAGADVEAGVANENPPLVVLPKLNPLACPAGIKPPTLKPPVLPGVPVDDAVAEPNEKPVDAGAEKVKPPVGGAELVAPPLDPAPNEKPPVL